MNGADGIQGPPGQTGQNGQPGQTGQNGQAGQTGQPGLNGNDGAPAPNDYAYLYNAGTQTVALEAGITLSTNGSKTSSISHTAGTSIITFTTTGVYRATVSVWGDGAFKMALFVNGVIVNGAAYGTTGASREIVGDVIVPITAGDVLEVRNHGSTGSFDLDSPSSPVDASVLIQRLA